MTTSMVPKIKYESMEEEGQNIINEILKKLGDDVLSVEYNKEPNRYPSLFENNVSGWLQIYVEFKNGYEASVVWSQYSYGGDRLLWELALMRDGEIIVNEDYTDVEGYLTCADILEHLTKISRYKNGE